ncbi:hypothetical protein MA16_Dca020655 [Dendrobium catenatum]|uniref:Uncharacterized protein n=1 Tax=Dendrobium catenatum TaxID=906689 RepID=A0A2I0XG76_9ASPA|nr:hypothetical protein MA16_Dca020655 [Dendrobium catenatum]
MLRLPQEFAENEPHPFSTLSNLRTASIPSRIRTEQFTKSTKKKPHLPIHSQGTPNPEHPRLLPAVRTIPIASLSHKKSRRETSLSRRL